MARRRYQHPSVKQTECADKSARRWYFSARIDVLKGTGEIQRIEKRIYLDDARTRREAEQKRDEILNETINKPAAMITSQVVFGVAIEKYLAMAQVRPQSRRHYESMIGTHIRPAWGKVRMCDITPLAVEEWLVAESREYTAATVRSVRGIFGGIWRAALRWGMTRDACPIGLVPQIKAVPQPRKKLLPTVEKFNELLAALKEPYRSIVWIAANTGMRIGEVLALRWEQWNAGAALIEESIQQNGEIGPVKAGARVVHLAHLHGSVLMMGTSGRMFETKYMTLRAAFKVAAAKAEIDYPGFGCHTLRRLHNTLFRRLSTKDLAMEQLGHSSEKMNDLYFIAGEHEAQKRVEVVERIAGMLGSVQ